MLAELREAGFRPRQDLGTIGGLTELRQLQQEGGITEIRVSAPTGQWYAGKIPDRHRLHQPRTRTFHTPPQYPGQNGAVISPRRTERAKITTTELWLIDAAAPDPPNLGDTPLFSPDPAAATIGFLNRTTPQAVREYAGKKPTPPQRRTRQGENRAVSPVLKKGRCPSSRQNLSNPANAEYNKHDSGHEGFSSSHPAQNARKHGPGNTA